MAKSKGAGGRNAATVPSRATTARAHIWTDDDAYGRNMTLNERELDPEEVQAQMDRAITGINRPEFKQYKGRFWEKHTGEGMSPGVGRVVVASSGLFKGMPLYVMGFRYAPRSRVVEGLRVEPLSKLSSAPYGFRFSIDMSDIQ